MYVTTMILLLLLALVLFKMEPQEIVTKIWLIAVYIISGFFGWFFDRKKKKEQKIFVGLSDGSSLFRNSFCRVFAFVQRIDGRYHASFDNTCTLYGVRNRRRNDQLTAKRRQNEAARHAVM